MWAEDGRGAANRMKAVGRGARLLSRHGPIADSYGNYLIPESGR